MQGLLVTAGLAGVIVGVQPLFMAYRARSWVAYRQGFLCNATNPKILVYYLSLLSQFVAPGAWWLTRLHQERAVGDLDVRAQPRR